MWIGRDGANRKRSSELKGWPSGSEKKGNKVIVSHGKRGMILKISKMGPFAEMTRSHVLLLSVSGNKVAPHEH